MSIRLLIVEDHAMFSELLSGLLSSERMEVCAVSADGSDAVELAREHQPDVVVMDLGLPHLNGMEATRRIREFAPRTRVIALTMHSENEYVVEALRAGVRGYVLKSQASEDIVEAIRRVHDGAVYLSPEISYHVVDALRRGEELEGDPLTTREREVLQLIAEGLTTREIAERLGISSKTVEAHRTNMMNKLDIRNAAGLVRYAVRTGIVSP